MPIHSPSHIPRPRNIPLRHPLQLPSSSTSSIPSTRATTPHPTPPTQATQSQLAGAMGEALAASESSAGVDDGDEGVQEHGVLLLELGDAG